MRERRKQQGRATQGGVRACTSVGGKFISFQQAKHTSSRRRLQSEFFIFMCACSQHKNKLQIPPPAAESISCINKYHHVDPSRIPIRRAHGIIFIDTGFMYFRKRLPFRRQQQQQQAEPIWRNFMTCEFGRERSTEKMWMILKIELSENQVNLGIYDSIHRLFSLSLILHAKNTRLIEGCLSSLCDWEQPHTVRRQSE